MSSFSLDFINEIKINEVAATTPRATTKKETNPPADFLGLRVWKDGSVFPSLLLTEKFSLEYPGNATVTTIDVHNEDGTKKLDKDNKQVTKRTVVFPEGTVANGLDVFTMADWTQLDPASRAHKCILVGVSPKTSPKVELFSNVKYNEDGTPQNSVLDQGANTYGKERLIPLLKEVYGIEIGEAGYVDLEINTGYNLKAKVSNGIFMLPKTIVRGTKAGAADYLRRENIDIFPLVPVSAPVQTTPIQGTLMEDSNELGLAAAAMETV
jgi:hypothetical protein